MDIIQAIEEIRHYFNLDLMPHSRDRLERILKNVSHERIVTKVKEVVVYATDVTPVASDVHEEAQRIGKLYNTNLEEMQSKKRDKNIVLARAHFARYMRLHSNYTIVSIAKFLKRDHSSIIHLLYDSKVPCAISPLYKRNTISCSI